jgi:hypothetical protein
MIKISLACILMITAFTNAVAQVNSFHYEMNDTEDPIIFTDVSIVLKSGGDISSTKFAIKNNSNTTFNFKADNLRLSVESYSVGKDGWILAAEGHSSGDGLFNNEKINSPVPELQPGKTFSSEIINDKLFEPNVKYRIYIRYKALVKGEEQYFVSYYSIKNIIKEENNNGEIMFSGGTGFAKENIDFKTSDFIYGRLQLKNSNVKDAFAIGALTDEFPYYAVHYTMKMEKDGKTLFDFDKGVGETFMLSKEQLSNNSLDFDVLPDPVKASTVLKYTDSKFIDMAKSSRIYQEINPQTFPDNGKYKITIRLYHKTYDAWQKELPKDKWVYFENSFNIEFNTADINLLKANGVAADKKINDAFLIIAASKKPLPEEWNYKTNPITSGYSQQAIIDWALGKGKKINLLKFYASEGSGYTTKSNEFGIPEYKYFNQGYTIFYKDLSDNKCYYIIDATIVHKYTGGGTFEKTPTLSHTAIFLADCDKMK